MLSSLRHAHERSQTQSVLRGPDATELGTHERIDVDHRRGAHDIELHQVDQGGAAGEKLRFALQTGRPLPPRQRLQGSRKRGCALVHKWSHGETFR
jgi:hypothetical protein